MFANDATDGTFIRSPLPTFWETQQLEPFNGSKGFASQPVSYLQHIADHLRKHLGETIGSLVFSKSFSCFTNSAPGAPFSYPWVKRIYNTLMEFIRVSSLVALYILYVSVERLECIDSQSIAKEVTMKVSPLMGYSDPIMADSVTKSLPRTSSIPSCGNHLDIGTTTLKTCSRWK
jgi:hypothetical protein